MDPLKFIFELIDQMTGPSKSIQKELKGIETQIKAADQALQRAAIGKMAPGLAKDRAELVLQRDALKDSAAAAQSFGEAMRGPREVLGSVAKVGLGVAGAAAGIGYEFAKTAVEVASFAENNKIALEVFTGSGETANRILHNMIGLAAHLPINDMQAMGAATQFMVQGFKEADLTNLITTMAAVQGFGHGKGGMENFVNQILEIKAAGVNARHLRALSQGTGIPEESIATSLSRVAPRYANIKTPEEMQKAIAMGQVNKDDFVEAVVKSVALRTGGDLATLPGKLSKTFSGLMSTIEGRPYALMIDLDTAPGYASFRGFLANLVTMTDPQSETGKAISGQLAASFNDLFGDIFAKYAGPDGAQKIGDTIRNDVLPAFRDVMEVVREISSLTMTIISGWASIIRLFRSSAETYGELSPAKQFGVRALGLIPGVGTTLQAAALYASAGSTNSSSTAAMTPDAQLRASKAGLLGPVDTFLGKLGIGQGNDYLHEAGVRASGGFSSGVREGIPDVMDAHREVAAAGVEATKGELQIHSPSRVFEELGAYTAEGYVRGVRGGTDDTQDALGAMVASPRGGGAGAFAVRDAGGRQIVINMPINVDARGAHSDDADDIAQKIKDAVPGSLVQAFEMIATEMGNN